MKTLKIIFAILITIALQVIFDHLAGVTGVAVAWIAPAIGAVTGLVSSLFGGKSDEEEAAEQYIMHLEESKGKATKLAGKQKGDLARMINSEITKRRSGASEIANSQGKSDPGFAYTKEEDLANNKIQGSADIDTALMQELSNIDESIATAKLNTPKSPSLLERGFKGVLGGANLGFDVENALGLDENPAKSFGGTGSGMNRPLTNMLTTGKMKKKKLNKYGSVSLVGQEDEY